MVRQILCSGAVVSTVLFAQTQGPLTLDDCIRLAQSAQSNVDIARRQVEIARHGITQARAGFLPQAFIGSGFTYNSPMNGELSFVALNGVREYQALGNVAMDIDTSGRLRAQLARARADQDIATAGLGLAQRDLRRAVATAYYRVLLGRRLVEVARASLDEAQAFERRTRLLAENGEAARADVVKAAAESAFLQQALNAADLEAQLANHELASFWTTEVERPLTLVDVLAQTPPVPESTQPNAPYRARLEFRLFEAQRRGFLADARRVRADLYPQLSFVQQYGIDATRLSWKDRGYASFINLHIPVFDWFKTRSAARQFDLQAQQVDINRQVSERTFSRDYRDAHSRVESIYGQITIADTQVKLSEENYRLARIRYEGGEGTALDVVSAQSQLAQARSNYFTAKANYFNARADLEVTSGR
jgi:outer membrane protein